EVTGKAVPLREGPRRAGDPPALVAAAGRANEVLGWRPHFTDLRQTVETAWNWHRTHPKGYGDRREWGLRPRRPPPPRSPRPPGSPKGCHVGVERGQRPRRPAPQGLGRGRAGARRATGRRRLQRRAARRDARTAVRAEAVAAAVAHARRLVQ